MEVPGRKAGGFFLAFRWTILDQALDVFLVVESVGVADLYFPYPSFIYISAQRRPAASKHPQSGQRPDCLAFSDIEHDIQDRLGFRFGHCLVPCENSADDPFGDIPHRAPPYSKEERSHNGARLRGSSHSSHPAAENHASHTSDVRLQGRSLVSQESGFSKRVQPRSRMPPAGALFYSS